MKKSLFVVFFIFCIFSFTLIKVSAQSPFPQALKTCETYSQTGGVSYEGNFYNISIDLEKTKKGCTYKEKISQGKGYQVLVCNFDQETLPLLADSMDRYNKAFQKEISKNKIFEAKMTTNGEIFQNYLINPKFCQVLTSNSKK